MLSPPTLSWVLRRKLPADPNTASSSEQPPHVTQVSNTKSKTDTSSPPGGTEKVWFARSALVISRLYGSTHTPSSVLGPLVSVLYDDSTIGWIKAASSSVKTLSKPSNVMRSSPGYKLGSSNPQADGFGRLAKISPFSSVSMMMGTPSKGSIAVPVGGRIDNLVGMRLDGRMSLLIRPTIRPMTSRRVFCIIPRSYENSSLFSVSSSVVPNSGITFEHPLHISHVLNVISSADTVSFPPTGTNC
mmetsp:Transcript_41708/g.100422  ORF Transcript_41708/g.100422 Transcript_41708/m.100422 type:complete len:244 (+) Transcript_41708:1451-2182(+)